MNKDKQTDADFALALSLQEQFENEAAVTVTKENTSETLSYPKSIVDASWEVVDPVPNIHQLFVDFDAMFFKSALVNSGVEVKWSHRMTLCAGVCSYEGRGGLCSVRLSSPLLKLRPRRDLVQTLLHEMIHAYLFVTANNKDHDAHGPNFLEHMHRINKLTGAKITVYHSFHNEVNEYRQHWWRCGGPCRSRPPYYGFVKRAMNRAPSPQDHWWTKHEATCGGKYVKVREPEGYKKKTSNASGPSNTSVKITADGKIVAGGKRSSNIKDFFSSSTKQGNADVSQGSEHSKGMSSTQLSSGQGHILKPSGAAAEAYPPSPNSIRDRLAAAAEKRLKASGVSGRRDTPTGRRGRVVGHGGRGSLKDTSTGSKRGHYSVVNGDSKSVSSSGVPLSLQQQTNTESATFSQSSLVDDCIVLDAEMPATGSRSPHSSQDTIFNLEDSPTSSYHISPNNIAKGSRDIATRPCDVIIDLENTTSELKMCPVCGRNDIPSPIINAHITVCLEEESLDSFLED